MEHLEEIANYNTLMSPDCNLEFTESFVGQAQRILDALAKYCTENKVKIRVQSIVEDDGELCFSIGHSGLDYYLNDHDLRIEEIIEERGAFLCGNRQPRIVV